MHWTMYRNMYRNMYRGIYRNMYRGIYRLLPKSTYRSLRKRIACLGIVLWVTACSTSPMGRNQATIFSEDTIRRQGEAAYSDIRRSEVPGTDPRQRHLVSCVTNRILNAMTDEERKDYNWEASLFERDVANAFALPGGKMGVYSGLFKYALNEHQLAAVMSHEVSHVLSGHSNEGASRSVLKDVGMLIGQVAGLPTQTLSTIDIATELGLFLPFNRAQETEADQLGLMLMARAGFDPEESIYLWRNMSGAGTRLPEMLSTHPSPESRIEDLQALMRPAKVLYEAAFAKGISSCNVQ